MIKLITSIIIRFKAVIIWLLQKMAGVFGLSLMPTYLIGVHVGETAKIEGFCAKSGFLRGGSSRAGRHAEKKIRRHSVQLALANRTFWLFRNDLVTYLHLEKRNDDAANRIARNTKAVDKLAVVGGASGPSTRRSNKPARSA